MYFFLLLKKDYAEFETFDSVVDKVDEDITEFLSKLK